MNKRTKKKIAKTIFKNPILLIPIAIILIIVAGFLAYQNFFAPSEQYEMPEGSAEVHYIDVGQGDSTLIFADGMTVLIDTGENDDKNTMINYLKGKSVETIDYFIITHFDSDHYGEATEVLEEFSVVNLIIPDQKKVYEDSGNEHAMYRTFMDKVKSLPDIYVSVIEASDDIGTRIEVDDIIDIDSEKDRTINVGVIDPEKEGDKADLELEFFAPVKDEYNNSNDYSIIVMVRWGETKLLFTGDAEKNGEKALVDKYGNKLDDILDCDVFKAGHHGSRTSSCQEFINAATPEYVIISCGAGNDYGHPHTEAMSRFESAVDSDKIYRTDTMGTIILTTNGTEITISTEK